jgi:outer membrane receptor for ferrienterochelin and colicin
MLGPSLYYQNYDEVTIDGVNIHYYRKITDKLKLKFVYNLTDASSDSQEILEGISKHALRANLDHAMLKRARVITSIKYSGKKTMFNQLNGAIQELPAYWLSDISSVTSFNNII